ncbi:MAG: 50S ribosomal protein L9 [Holosporales bacterium]|jgi:large subunit ribosomal protein L9|nr:50S ribosomal protein L9 [Holosporales bacterium]
MQVILLGRMPKLGMMGDIVNVKTGYARNFLLPQKMALRATPENLEYFSKKKTEFEANNLKLKKEAEVIAEKMSNVSITIIRQASESGFLFGSVRLLDIVEGLSEQGYVVSKSQIRINSPIKTIGTYKIGISLHPEVTVEVSVRIMTSKEQTVIKHNQEKDQNTEEDTAEEYNDSRS